MLLLLILLHSSLDKLSRHSGEMFCLFSSVEEPLNENNTCRYETLKIGEERKVKLNELSVLIHTS